MRAFAKLLIPALPIMMTACSEEFLRSTSSTSFGDGYKAGCENGTSMASNKTREFVRDDQRYLNDPDYARGCRSGNQECNGDNFKFNPNDSMQPVEIDGPMGVYDR